MRVGEYRERESIRKLCSLLVHRKTARHPLSAPVWASGTTSPARASGPEIRADAPQPRASRPESKAPSNEPPGTGCSSAGSGRANGIRGVRLHGRSPSYRAGPPQSHRRRPSLAIASVQRRGRSSVVSATRAPLVGSRTRTTLDVGAERHQQRSMSQRARRRTCCGPPLTSASRPAGHRYCRIGRGQTAAAPSEHERYPTQLRPNGDTPIGPLPRRNVGHQPPSLFARHQNDVHPAGSVGTQYQRHLDIGGS